MSTPAMSPQNNARPQQIAAAKARVIVSANWFLWIAGLSVVNTLISMGGGRMRFIFGLGITSVLDAVGHQSGNSGQSTALIMSILAAAVIAMFGFFGRKEMKWAFLVGMALYACDGLLLLKYGVYLSAAFHAWALFRLFVGLQAVNTLETLRSQQSSDAGAMSTSWQR
ncbi:hypothetical protein Acid345_0087 [Candidatus Koribacter versatilis Ellin345]|uniref:Uncharacterized protein n=1 Tax=Koribacter versatilis (strain Ellin345) TaxID=204669 RepID=Q1IVK8_KORVE|nr:hypothetical protein [Candidatus Koribacter versatilis]ABF39092.1 hypothetical protein Acid345_0087 [Candidatus Koribacter versatilis Ellin345]